LSAALAQEGVLMRLVLRSHNVRVLGSLAGALLLTACGSARDAAEDLLDGLRDASFGLPDGSLGLPDASFGQDGGHSASDASAWDTAVGDDDSSAPDGDIDGASSEAGADAETNPSVCGDGVLAPDERCDTAIAAGSAGACPSSCSADAQNTCSRAMLVGTGCSAQCEQTVIAACTNDDDCCANGCTLSNDNDCQAMCGNSVIEGTEVCDGNCPANCNDSNACTTDSATGDASTCNRVCAHTPISACTNGDGCCAPGCNNGNDNDCSATCGDMIVNNGERCDGNCPGTCNDSNACTSDVLSGTPAQCNVQCTSTAITACKNGDGCCPSSCRGNNDNDCPSVCGNDVVEPGEECEPTMADDPNCSDNCLLPATECLNGAEDRGEDRTNVCVACGCNECTSELKACYDATDVAAGGPAAGTSRATLCAAVVTCGRTSGCTGQACYCGTTSGLGCLNGANGPCKTQIERAAESTSAITISGRQMNLTYAIGRANAVSTCSVSNCSTPCDL
jgi:hypothetical protein